MSWDFGGGYGGRPGPRVPFAGVPTEMQAGVASLVAKEPAHPDTSAPFTYVPSRADAARLTFRRLLSAHWRLGIGAVLTVVLVAVANQVGPKLVVRAIDDGMLRHSVRTLVVVTVLFVLATVVTAVAQRWLTQLSGRLAARVMNDLRIRVFSHLQRLSLDFYTREKAGVVMTRMTSDVENLQQLLQDGLPQMAVQALTMVVISVVLFAMNPMLAAITIGITVPPLVVMSLWFRARSEVGYDRVRDGIAAVLADLSESLRGIRVVTAHNRSAHNVIHHRNVVGAYRDANNYTARISAIYAPGTQLLGYLGQAVLLGIGGNMVRHGSLTIGELVAFFLYLNRFYTPIQLLVQQYTTYQQSRASLTKLQTLFDTAPSVVEEPDASTLPPVIGAIEFANVTFGYTPDRPVLKHVNLSITPGETVAFVGPTGAGKSSLAKLVTRFYDPDQGRVLVDGHDIRRVSLASLRHQIGVVPQEPFLFAGSLRDNIAFGGPDATDAEIDRAVDAVGLRDLVDRLPDGLDTEVHERGDSLSSGERQLVALARAFLAQPRVLVLDEATANLDLQSEAAIEAGLETLLDNRTAILIAHRLSTAMKSDRIVVVEDGQIVEAGPHDELVSAGGRYAAMFEAWMSHIGEAAA